MAHDPTQDHPDYGRIRGGAQFATQHFEDATELDEAGLDPATDVESNELTAAEGQTCARCHKPIEAGAEVRRTASGDYQHEMCPFHMTTPAD